MPQGLTCGEHKSLSEHTAFVQNGYSKFTCGEALQSTGTIQQAC